jgi:hypothetical protein
VKSFLLLAVAALALAGCGASGGGPGAGGPAADDPRQPEGDPPSPGVMADDAPPPAWIETRRGSVWLGYATYCWGSTCADAGPPDCGKPYSPYVEVDPGEEVRFHLGFRPVDARLVHFAPDGALSRSEDSEPLEAARVMAWDVSREGPFWLSASVGGGGDASYAACLRFPAEEVTVVEALDRGSGDVAVRGSLFVEGDDVRLCDGLAESYPPQCPGPHLRLEGFSAEALEGLTRAGAVAWSEEPTIVRGRLSGTTLVVSPSQETTPAE